MHMRGAVGAHVRVCSEQVVDEVCAHSPRHRGKVVVAEALCREGVRGVSGKAGSIELNLELRCLVLDKETNLTRGRPRRAPERSHANGGSSTLATPMRREPYECRAGDDFFDAA